MYLTPRQYLMSSVSLSAMSLSLMLYQEQDDRHSEKFLEYRTKAEKHLLRMTIHGRPYQPMFRPTHFIQPSNSALG